MGIGKRFPKKDDTTTTDGSEHFHVSTHIHLLLFWGTLKIMRKFSTSASSLPRIVIVGGGTAGVGVAAMLKGVGQTLIVEPQADHHFQPLWTLVGGGLKQPSEVIFITNHFVPIITVGQAVRKTKDMIGDNASWVKQRVATFEPSKNQVVLNDGSRLPYDVLVVATGLQIDWTKISGLADALEEQKANVVSIYHNEYAKKTWEAIQSFKQGRAIFTFPPGLIKCAGAPQKIMSASTSCHHLILTTHHITSLPCPPACIPLRLLSTPHTFISTVVILHPLSPHFHRWMFDDRLRHLGQRSNAQIEFFTAGMAMFGVPKYAAMLDALRKERDVAAHFERELVAVDWKNKTATFKGPSATVGGSGAPDQGVSYEEPFDLLHVTPPMSAPDLIKSSPFANAAGWMDVDKHTLQSPSFPNVFGIGDCTSTPNSKTAAAITAQAPVLVHNLKQLLQQKPLDGVYNGYASCPLIVANDKVILAEFGYDGKIMETFDTDTGKFPYNLLGQHGSLQQQLFMKMVKDVFPWVYWNLWPRGRWFGPSTIFKPDVVRAAAKAL